jgi:hypothetical protein
VSAAWLVEAVEAVNEATQDLGLQVDVSHEAWIGQDVYGAPRFADPVALQALVQEGTNQVRLRTGDTITTRACISFLAAITPHGAAHRREPIDPRDRVTLPSGLTGPVVDNPGSIINPDTARPHISVFWLR